MRILTGKWKGQFLGARKGKGIGAFPNREGATNVASGFEWTQNSIGTIWQLACVGGQCDGRKVAFLEGKGKAPFLYPGRATGTK